MRASKPSASWSRPRIRVSSIILKALDGDALALSEGGKRAVIVANGQMTDAVSGQSAGAAPANLETIVINNRIRGELGAALAALRLGSADRGERLTAAKELQGSDNEEALPIIERAIARESDAGDQERPGARRRIAGTEEQRTRTAREGRARARRQRRSAGATTTRDDADAGQGR